MSTYAIIETGGQQLRVEPGRFYNIRHFASLMPSELEQNTKILIYRVLMIRRESDINIGHPWLRGAVVKGRILHSCLENKIMIYKMICKKKTRRKLGYRQKSTRFVVDSIFLDGEEIYK
uniref:Large ribosomal subunit protein bL21c n=1 Tax=Apopellia endiviifolia TaxID=304445 RepID=K4K856_9MARC|nr:ribosomal protein L21 [Apopellia endiviifolia]AFU88893.1 ribosomal protein L21 [Apopellia endiviifolia]WIA67776.1 ribosomal protein L21 [Apopellia endiviifolia]WKW94985.1 ribosomal protein L21 [Apopellia endiviifolia]